MRGPNPSPKKERLLEGTVHPTLPQVLTRSPISCKAGGPASLSFWGEVRGNPIWELSVVSCFFEALSNNILRRIYHAEINVSLGSSTFGCHEYVCAEFKFGSSCGLHQCSRPENRHSAAYTD